MAAFIPQQTLSAQLFELLKRYGLPETATRFSVHVAAGDVVKVDCDFMALEPQPDDE